MQGVQHDRELDRILKLPRRPLEWDEATTEKARDLLTKWLKTENGTWRLNAIQARCLVEAHDTGKLAMQMVGPGAGKSLISGILPVVVKAQRTCLLVPAALRYKTIDDFDVLSQHWKMPTYSLAEEKPKPENEYGVIRILSYESLSSVRYATWLTEFDPDLIVADEAHALQSMKSGRTKRLFRHIKETRKRGQRCQFIPMSGSGWSTKLGQVAHLLEAALEKGSPLPTDYVSLMEWGMALDVGVKERDRYAIGALRLLTPDESNPSVESVRRGLRDRIISTPSIITTKTASCTIPLILQRRDIEVPANIRTAMRKLRQEYTLPTEEPSEGGVVAWNHAREIANGFFYRWDPPPPVAWREARSAWIKFVNNAMQYTRKINLDTPLQVWNAVEAGHFGVVKEFNDWKAIRDTFKPNTVPVWLNDYLVKDAEAWATKTGGIVWVMHSTAYNGIQSEDDEDKLGQMFETIPYFGAGDERIKTYRGPCAASVRAHGTGKNLQQWSEALIMGFPSSGKTTEQLLARLHRPGQDADVVKFYFYAHSTENLNAIEKCIQDAAFVKDTSGADQRILDAIFLDSNDHTFDIQRYRDSRDPNDAMWGSMSNPKSLKKDLDDFFKRV